MDETDTAANACITCKQYKRKCNKALPSCSTCTRLRRTCNYSLPGPIRATPEEEISLLRARVDELEQLVDKSLPAKNGWSTTPGLSPRHETYGQKSSSVSSSLFFLDQRAFEQRHSRLEQVLVPVTDEILNALKDENDNPQVMGDLLFRYFDSIHHWMPIISKLRIHRVVERPMNELKADTGLLLLCMKLLLSTPQNNSISEGLELYTTIKMVKQQLELTGLQTITAIQCDVMIAVYELGHGIYPACYNTVARCARQAVSLGYYRRESPQFLQPWPEWEEEIRLWWFIVMLDRHVTVGRELHPLCTEDPNKHMPLPADNEEWDRGTMIAPERLYISSTMTAITSPYARLAQAYNLLGRVIRHCDDQEQDMAFMLNEMSSLHQATSALLEMTSKDEPQNSYLTQAVSFIALFKLHKNFLHNSFHQKLAEKSEPPLAVRIREYTEASFITMRDTALKTLDLALWLEQNLATFGMERLSPLVLHCLYRGAFWLSYLASTNREERFLAARLIFDRVFKAVSVRWKVADTYLDMLALMYEEYNVAD